MTPVRRRPSQVTLERRVERRRVLDYLETHGQCTRDELIQSTGARSRNRAESIINELVHKGVVNSVRRDGERGSRYELWEHVIARLRSKPTAPRRTRLHTPDQRKARRVG